MKKSKIFFYGFLTAFAFLLGYIKYYNMNLNDIGLNVLGWVKNIKGESVDLGAINSANTLTMEHREWTNLLQQHVTEKGLVNYLGFIQDSVLLQKYLDELGTHIPGKNWTEREQLAYWINAYNAFTVKLILDNYPLKSIKDITDGLPMINSPWDIKFFKIGKVDFDLNTIEHEILRKQFNEPRIHFAINCASFSCPKLRNEAYIASELEAQLDAQTSSFINNTDKNIINNKETKLSKIFDWFKLDFSKKSDLLDYIKKYHLSLNQENKVEYLKYNWALNE